MTRQYRDLRRSQQRRRWCRGIRTFHRSSLRDRAVKSEPVLIRDQHSPKEEFISKNNYKKNNYLILILKFYSWSS